MLKQISKYFINNLLKLFSLQINKITLSNNFNYYIVQTLKYYKIDIVIDIGANEGQFAKNIIQYGYKNKIISFEPIKNIHQILKKNSKNYNNWIIEENIGFGEKYSVAVVISMKITNFNV